MRRQLLALVATLALPALPAAATETFTFDPGHSEVIFSYSHLGNSTAHGEFRTIEGTVTLDEEKPENSKIDVTIAASSVDTGVAAFDEHLQSADFFEAETYPEIRFVSQEVTLLDDKTAEITGDLTIKDVTKPVIMEATLNYIGEHQLAGAVPDYEGVYVAGFSAEATLLRSDFDVGMLAPMVGDEVTLNIQAELFRQ